MSSFAVGLVTFWLASLAVLIIADIYFTCRYYFKERKQKLTEENQAESNKE